MAIRNITFVVFLFPVVVSLLIGTFVLAEVLKEPDRELNMLQFEFSGDIVVSSGAIKITGLQNEYSSTQPIQIDVSINDSTFDCGDLYITIYDLNLTPKQVVTQSGYFGQCFERNNLMLPIDDEFSETVDVPGQYEIVVEMNDKNYKTSISGSEKFIVK